MENFILHIFRYGTRSADAVVSRRYNILDAVGPQRSTGNEEIDGPNIHLGDSSGHALELAVFLLLKVSEDIHSGLIYGSSSKTYNPLFIFYFLCTQKIT